MSTQLSQDQNTLKSVNSGIKCSAVEEGRWGDDRIASSPSGSQFAVVQMRSGLSAERLHLHRYWFEAACKLQTCSNMAGDDDEPENDQQDLSDSEDE